jgi:hypothetical protein
MTSVAWWGPRTPVARHRPMARRNLDGHAWLRLLRHRQGELLRRLRVGIPALSDKKRKRSSGEQTDPAAPVTEPINKESTCRFPGPVLQLDVSCHRLLCHARSARSRSDEPCRFFNRHRQLHCCRPGALCQARNIPSQAVGIIRGRRKWRQIRGPGSRSVDKNNKLRRDVGETATFTCAAAHIHNLPIQDLTPRASHTAMARSS